MRAGRWRRSLVALLASMALSLAALVPAASAQQPQQDPAFGVNAQTLINWVWNWGSQTEQGTPAPQWDPYLTALQDDGVGVARTDAPWAWVQPQASSSLSDNQSWARLDQLVMALAGHGLRWQPVIDLAPSWATQAPNAPRGCPAPAAPAYLPPADPAQYAAYAGALAARYGANGTFWPAHPSVPKVPIADYEIWNEPNVDAYWNDAPSPTQYVALYNAARTAILAADRSAKVWVGGVVWGGQVDCVANTSNDAAFIDGLFAAGGANWPVDGIAVHPYGPAVLNIVANLRRVQRALQTAGRTDVPLEQTELGWPSAPGGAPAGTAAAGYQSDASRAGTYALAADTTLGSDCNVQSYDAYTAVEREDQTVAAASAASIDEDPPGVSPYDLVEHWMGMYRLTDALSGRVPGTLTSAAYAAAIARDLASDNAGHDIAVCGSAGTAGRLLPLSLSLGPAAQPGCFNATVTYEGLPVYGAELQSSVAIQADGVSFGPAFTDPDGIVGFCVAGDAQASVTAQVGAGSFDPDLVPLVARSNAVLTDGAGGSTTTSTSTSTSSGPSDVTTEVGTATSPGMGTSTPTITTTATRAGTSATGNGPPLVPSAAPSCVLSSLRPATPRLAGLLRHGLRVTLDMATTIAGAGCSIDLTLRSSRGGTLGSAHALVRHRGSITVTVRLSTVGRRVLLRRRAVTLDLRLDLGGAPVGLGTLTRPVRLYR